MKSLFTFLLCFVFAFANGQDSTALQFSKNITQESLEKHLKTLASDAYEGRGTGTRGQKKAAFYIKSHFKTIGLQPSNPKDSAKYYQYFIFDDYKYQSFNYQIQAKNRQPIKPYLYYINHVFELQNSAMSAIWVGHGFDYSGIDVKNKIAIIWLGEVPEKYRKKYDLGDKPSDVLSAVNIKVDIAKKNGAKAIFFIHQSKENYRLFSARSKSFAKINRSTYDLQDVQNTFPIIYFHPKVGDNLLKISANKFSELVQNPSAESVESIIDINFHVDYKQNFTENVLGYIPGTTLKNEFIIVSAHYDHLGKTANNTIYNGADDNASGTSTLLNLATEMMTAYKQGFKPKRSIIFVAFSGEELGLLGSAYLSSNLQIPINSIKTVYNIDMIGRGRFLSKTDHLKLYVLGDKPITDKNQQIVEQHFSRIKLDYAYNSKEHPERLYYRSDHYNFAKYGVPFIFYTTGLHKDYHLETDDSDKINYEGLQLVAQLIFLNVWEASR